MPTAWPAHIALIVVQLFFGSLPVMGKYALGALAPMALVTLRILGAAVLLGVIRQAARLPGIPDRTDHLKIVVYAVFGVALNQVLFLEGLSRTTAVNASVLTTAIPVNTTVLAILAGQERMTGLKAVGILVSLVGALLLIGTGGLDFGNRYLIGNLLIYANTVSYSIYLVISKPMLERYPPLSVVTLVFGYSLLMILPFGAPAVLRVPVTEVNPYTWLALGGIIVFPTVGAYLLNSWALKQVQASLVAVYIYLQPLVTTGLGVWLLGEQVTVRTLEAAVLIFAGVGAVTHARRQEGSKRIS